MNNLHPAFALALAPFSPKDRTRSCTELLKLDFYGPSDEIEVKCFYLHDEEERGFRENGIPLEPDHPERVQLVRIVANGVDLLPVLPEKLVGKLEAQILRNVKEGVL